MKDVTTILLREVFVSDTVPRNIFILEVLVMKDAPIMYRTEEFAGSMGEGVELIS